MSTTLATYLYIIGSSVLFLAGIVSASALGLSRTSLLLGSVSALYAIANILLFVVLPNLK